MIERFDRAMSAVARAASLVAGAMLVLIVAINAANVFGRYVLSRPISWAEEVMLFLMIAGVFLSNIKITGDGAHIRMDMLLRFVAPGVRRALEILADLTTLAVAALVCWVGVPVVAKLAEFGQTSDAAGIPVALPQSVIPISFGLVVLTLGARLLARGPGGSAFDSDDQSPP